MGAISTLSSYLSNLATPDQTVTFARGESTSAIVAGQWQDLFIGVGPAGAAPGAAAVPTNATLGSLEQADGGSGVVRALGGFLSAANVHAGTLVLCDRLSHQSGLSGIVSTAQTTNLATAALTRYTSGVGVMAGLTIYTAVGTGAATVSVSYTNTVPTAGQTSPTRSFFAFTGQNRAGRFIPLPLVAGDLGVKSVESVTLSATTGTAGNFGVTLYKPLAFFPLDTTTPRPMSYFDGMIGGLPEIVDGACLFWLFMPREGDGTAPQVVAGSLLLSED